MVKSTFDTKLDAFLAKVEQTLATWEAVKINRGLTQELIAEGTAILAQAKKEARDGKS